MEMEFNLADLARKTGIGYDTLYGRYRRASRLKSGDALLREITKPVVVKNGRVPTRYGDRTFKGWAEYYDVWGVRKPCARTISSYYNKAKGKGYTDDEIIAQQRRLWIEGKTARHTDRELPTN